MCQSDSSFFPWGLKGKERIPFFFPRSTSFLRAFSLLSDYRALLKGGVLRCSLLAPFLEVSVHGDVICFSSPMDPFRKHGCICFTLHWGGVLAGQFSLSFVVTPFLCAFSLRNEQTPPNLPHHIPPPALAKTVFFRLCPVLEVWIPDGVLCACSMLQHGGFHPSFVPR